MLPENIDGSIQVPPEAFNRHQQDMSNCILGTCQEA